MRFVCMSCVCTSVPRCHVPSAAVAGLVLSQRGDARSSARQERAGCHAAGSILRCLNLSDTHFLCTNRADSMSCLHCKMMLCRAR